MGRCRSRGGRESTPAPPLPVDGLGCPWVGGARQSAAGDVACGGTVGAGMSLERSPEYRLAARAVLRWSAAYTRGLDARVAAARQDEIASDLHEHAVWANESGMSTRQLARSVRWRAVSGVPADLAWRAAQRRAADRGLRFALRANSALLAAVLTVGLGTAALSVFVIVRVVRALRIGDIGYVPNHTVVIGALAVAALSGCALLLRHRSRALGALLLTIPVGLILPVAGAVLWYVSASTVVVIHHAPWWGTAAAITGAALAVLCLAAAAYWWGIERRATSRRGEVGRVRP
jgi:hypothetical protein